MNKNSYKVVATVGGLLFSVAFAQNATAEDGNYYANQAAAQAQSAQGNIPPASYDSQYVVPPSYQGETYPQEEQTAVGYYNTDRTSDNTNHIADDQAYYLYYY